MTNDHGPSEEDKRKFYQKWGQLMDELQILIKEGEKYNAIRKEFCDRFTHEVVQLTVDFVPEMVPDKKLLSEDIFKHSMLVFEDVSELLSHYKDGKDGYCFGLYEPKFELHTMSETTINQILKPIKKQETWDMLNESFRQDYAETFYYKVYEYHIFKLLKKLIPEYQKEVFDLPSQGFYELEGLLYIAMLETFEIVRETQHGDPYFIGGEG